MASKLVPDTITGRSKILETIKETQTREIQSWLLKTRQKLDILIGSEDAHGDEKVNELHPLHFTELYSNS